MSPKQGCRVGMIISKRNMLHVGGKLDGHNRYMYHFTLT